MTDNRKPTRDELEKLIGAYGMLMLTDGMRVMSRESTDAQKKQAHDDATDAWRQVIEAVVAVTSCDTRC